MKTHFARAYVPALGLALLLGGGACSPKVYVIDRQTVFEEEAAGQWPQFEKELLKRAPSGQPEPYGQVPDTAKKKRLYRVLNGEMPTVAKTAGLTPAPQRNETPKKSEKTP